MKPMIDKKLKKLFSKALKKHQKGNLNEAKNIYNKIIKINPNIDVVQNNLGISSNS